MTPCLRASRTRGAEQRDHRGAAGAALGARREDYELATDEGPKRLLSSSTAARRMG